MMTEFKAYGPIQIAASRAGARLFRNHVGTGYQIIGKRPDGWRPPPFLGVFRFGLVTGSADFVGWTPVVVTQEMVGRTLAVFSSVEVKEPNWHETPAWAAGEQADWLRGVRAAGGIACVARTPEEATTGLQL